MKYDYINFLKDCLEEDARDLIDNELYWNLLKEILKRSRSSLNSSIEKLLKKEKMVCLKTERETDSRKIIVHSNLRCIESFAAIFFPEDNLQLASEVLVDKKDEDKLIYSYKELLQGKAGVFIKALTAVLEEGESKSAKILSFKNGIWLYDNNALKEDGKKINLLERPKTQDDLNYFEQYIKLQESLRKNAYILPDEYWLQYVDSLNEQQEKFSMKVIGEDSEKQPDISYMPAKPIPFPSLTALFENYFIENIPNELGIEKITGLDNDTNHSILNAILFGGIKEEEYKDKQLTYKKD